MVLDTPMWRISLSLISLQNDKLRWWSIFREPEHELVGKIQLYINFSTSADETSHPKVNYFQETLVKVVTSFGLSLYF